MAKIKEADILSVTATYYFSPEMGRYPISWSVRSKAPAGSRTFASYGKDAKSYPYPLEKLPKAVQSFIESSKASRPMHIEGDMQVVRFA